MRLSWYKYMIPKGFVRSGGFHAVFPASPGEFGMGHISKAEVEKVAELARLDLTEAEKSLFGGQLSQILSYVDQLQSVSTEGIPRTSSVAENESEWREDVVAPGLTLEQAMANAPDSNQGLFMVPKIIGK